MQMPDAHSELIQGLIRERVRSNWPLRSVPCPPQPCPQPPCAPLLPSLSTCDLHRIAQPPPTDVRVRWPAAIVPWHRRGRVAFSTRLDGFGDEGESRSCPALHALHHVCPIPSWGRRPHKLDPGSSSLHALTWLVLCMCTCTCIVVCRRECGLGCGRLTAAAPSSALHHSRPSGGRAKNPYVTLEV